MLENGRLEEWKTEATIHPPFQSSLCQSATLPIFHSDIFAKISQYSYNMAGQMAGTRT